MAEYHVGCGVFAIYAGTLNKSKTLWQNKSECTDEAVLHGRFMKQINNFFERNDDLLALLF